MQPDSKSAIVLIAVEMTGSLRARKKAATEAALQEAALFLFVEKGYDQTTIEEIVARADVSRRTFFRYFGSKEEVIFKGAEQDLDAIRRLVTERPSDETDLQALKHAILGFVRYLEAREAPVLSFVNVILNSGTLTARSAELQLRWTITLSEALAERHSAPPNINCRLLASLGMAAMAYGIQEWSLGVGDDLSGTVEQMFRPMEEGSLFQ